MTDLIKYPEWQPAYLTAVMEGDMALLPEKLFRAESAILKRQLLLASSDGNDNAEERKALEAAINGLRLLKTTILDHPDWK